jgi:dTDP-4-amino-4,6-dideoxygalactose transaminase
VELRSIPFNKPYLTGKELAYISEAVQSGKISGNGLFTQKCHAYFEKEYGFKKCLLTTSGTDALEMAAILIGIKAEDEVIMPSYTFVSTANAFVLRGAKIVFCDSSRDNPNLDVELIEGLITKRTKAIVPVHYAGIACDMDAIFQIADKYALYVIEDAAQAIDSYYNKKRLGSIGNLAAFSFHETQNIQSGEGGMLVINDSRFIERAEIIWEKGTNRSAFFRGETDKYSWVDIGSSYLPSDIIAAFLYAQIENLDPIQTKRRQIWHLYFEGLKSLQEEGKLQLPFIPEYATNNAHMFYLVCNTNDDRVGLIEKLRQANILAVFHYLSLHNSVYYRDQRATRELPQSDRYSERLVRLPIYFELTEDEQKFIISVIHEYYANSIAGGGN